MRAKSKKFLFYSGWGLNYLANAGSICFNKGNTLCNPVLLRVQILVFQTYFSPSKMILVDMPKPLHKKKRFSLKISSVNVTKSGLYDRLGHIY